MDFTGERLFQRTLKFFTLALFLIVGTTNWLAATAQSGDKENLPILLLVMESPAGTKTKDDLNIAIKETLRDAINDSKQYSLHFFLPNESLIKRALRERQLSAEDLLEPYKQDGLERVAKVIGAQYVLVFHSVAGKTTVTTRFRMLENANPDIWTSKMDNQAETPWVFGKKRLKPEDIARVVTDQITAPMGIPTHLGDNLAALTSTKTAYDPEKGRKKPAKKDASPKNLVPNDKSKTDPLSNGKEPIADGTTVDPDKPAIPSEVAERGNSKKISSPKQPKSGANSKKAIKEPLATQPVSHSSQTPEAASAADKNDGNAQSTVLTTDRPNYLEQGIQFRKTGDLSNAISSFRKAVNERPYDTDIRRQLAIAYQEKKLPDAALAEATRILQLDPNNPALYRLYGELLLQQGDFTGAIQALRESIRLAPADIGIQVSLGDALLKTGKFSEAVSVYEASVKSDPKSPLPHRRLARAFAGRAESELTQYQASLEQIKAARELTPAKETQTYHEDYLALLKMLEKRLAGMLIELSEFSRLKNAGKSGANELLRETKDLKERAEKLSDFLESLPPASGLEASQLHLSQSDSFLIQAINFFRELLQQGDDRVRSAMMNAQIASQRELDTAGKKLAAAVSKL